MNNLDSMHAADLLSRRAELTPERIAMIEMESGVQHTYAELNQNACRLANWMRSLGVQKGDRVSILANNGMYYLDLFYGLAKIGAIFAPLNYRLTARELEYIINDCEPKVLICGPEYTQVLAEMRSTINVQICISLQGADMPGALSYEQHMLTASPAEPVRPAMDGETPYCLLYTSGTTGQPKGAIIAHRHVWINCVNTIASWGIGENDCSPVLTPLYHAGGLFAFLTPLLYIGGRVVLARNFDPEASLRGFMQYKCTVILGVPTLFQMWMNSPIWETADFSHVHYFINGGAKCPPALMQTWRERKQVIFRQGYGLTEVGPNCFSMTDEESLPKSGSVGKPIFHSQMRLVNPETGAEVPTGEAGELLIRGPHVCQGYWHNPDATAAAIKDGWFYTGDMATRDEDGFYTIVGRFKDMIKSGGENIYAAEVEGVFREHPAVVDAGLIGKPDVKWGEIGLMIVQLKPGQQVTEADLLEFCRGRLARYKIPRQVIFTPELPYSPYGKLEKITLKKRYLDA